MMMLGAKDTRRIVPHFVLSQFCKKFGIRGSLSTLRFGRCLALRTLKHLKSAHFSTKNGCFSVFCGPHRHKNVCKHPFCVHLSLVSYNNGIAKT